MTSAHLILAIDGGATRTRVGLYDNHRALVTETSGGPSNPVVCGMDASVRNITTLCLRCLEGLEGTPLIVAAGISGATRHREPMAQALASALNARRAVVTNDLYPLLFANAGVEPGVVVIAGTGSSVVGQNAAGETLIVGGKGTLLGDDGSGYQIAVTALRGITHALDVLQTRARLADGLAKAAGLDTFEDFVVWSHNATKEEIAQLSETVLEFANNGDDFALKCLESQASLLAGQAVSALIQLHLRPDTPIYLSGGLFEHSSRYRAMFERALLRPETTARPVLAALRGHRAVAELAFAETIPAHLPLAEAEGQQSGGESLSPTEGHASDEVTIDRLTAQEIVKRMNRADASVAVAVNRCSDEIARAIEFAAEAIASGGRIIYTGAGTSGRLGVLDASECPPTFGVPPERVVGIMAGSDRALRDSVEGAEDDESAARTDLTLLHPPLGARDVVVGIAASGTTPYVKAGLRHAAACGARTVLLCCNPRAKDSADCVIAVDTGAEVVAGSTRLKAGTATKMVLNMISTGAMALAGYVYDGRMVRMRPANSKLRRRAARMVSALTGLTEDLAARRLEDAGDDIAVAVLMTRLALDREQAIGRLNHAHGNLRRALEES